MSCTLNSLLGVRARPERFCFGRGGERRSEMAQLRFFRAVGFRIGVRVKLYSNSSGDPTRKNCH